MTLILMARIGCYALLMTSKHSYVSPLGLATRHTHIPAVGLYMSASLSVLQCVAVCCSVLQCVAVCCSVLQCAAVCCSVLQCAVVRCSVLQYVAIYERVTQHVTSDITSS